MVNFKEEIAKLIAEQVSDLELSEIQEMIEVPQDSKMGERLCEHVLIEGRTREGCGCGCN